MAETQPTAVGNGASLELPFLGSKRQRRPSIRLGEIGEPPAAITYEPYVRRSKQVKHNHSPPKPPLPKSRPAAADTPDPSTDIPPSPVPEDRALVPVHEKLELLSIKRGNRDGKSRRATPSARSRRSRWASKINNEGAETDALQSGGVLEGSKEFDDLRCEDSESGSDRVRVSGGSHGGHTAQEMNEPLGNGGDWSLEEGGVRSWLNRLGLGRYTPLFEVHEVDDEVLSLLTLEDLKDMGINAVGSRRKMYSAIQKLGKGVS